MVNLSGTCPRAEAGYHGTPTLSVVSTLQFSWKDSEIHWLPKH